MMDPDLAGIYARYLRAKETEGLLEQIVRHKE